MDFFAIFKGIIDTGPTVLLPVVIFLIAIVFRVSFGKALESALIVGAAFTGLKIVIEFMAKSLGPATKAMVTHMGVHLNVIDMGFGTVAAIGWSSPIVPIVVLAIMSVNIILLLLNKTNTLSVDIWNYHHGLTMGTLVYFATNSILISVAAAACTALVMFKMADWAAPLVSNYYKIPGVTIPALHALMNLPVVAPLNLLFDKLPGLNKIDFNMETLRKYLGVFGQPLVIGLILGTFIGIFADYNIYKALGLGINMAAAMLLLPRMTHLFVEGLKPISEKAKKLTDEKLHGRSIFIGLDPAVLFGDPAVITTALLMVPILIALAVILPGNNFLPFADLGALPYKVAMCVAVTNGNIFRSIILCTIAFIPYFYFGTWTASIVTTAAQTVGLGDSIPNGMMISSFTGTTMPITFFIYKAFVGNLMITIPILIIAFFAVWIIIDKKIMPNLKIIKDHVQD
ncbi:MAG: system Galactitol-specific component [Firmicutes bacterium]|nr:system Galactitol-specific component [Bacillota bacterium]